MKVLVFLSLLYSCYGTTYDRFSGLPSTQDDLLRYESLNTTFYCAIDIAPCDPHEGRRIDGSCNNLKHPARGAGHTPFKRMLPAMFTDVNKPRKTASGRDLPPPRRVRTSCLAEGRVPSTYITQLCMYSMEFMSGGLLSLHDIINYVFERDCCSEAGKTDPQCFPTKVPDDDPVHRFSDIRCLNLTIPKTHQTFGCIKDNTTEPERIVFNTPIFDLLSVYGYSASAIEQFRIQNGLLKYEVDNGIVWPPSLTPANAANECILNEPTETRCHDAPNTAFNALIGTNFFSVMYWRQHNNIARRLYEVNPCWTSDKLFDTAKDINIAISMQIFLYELLPTLCGKTRLENDGILGKNKGFRPLYNASNPPQLYLEYPYVLRYFHTMQEGVVQMFNPKGEYYKEIPIVNLTLRTGWYNKDGNMAGITQGSFRQASAAADYIVDPHIAEMGLGRSQKAVDVLSSDLSKGGLFGFPPWVDFRNLLFGDSIKSWEDAKGIIHEEHIECLKNNYENIGEVDFMAGMWMEKQIPGGIISPLVYKVIAKQVLESIQTDRHHYELKDRPYAFTLEQLHQIRKMTIASVMCDNADSVTEIQPHAFMKIGPGNKLVDCSQIERIDYSAWKDDTCDTTAEETQNTTSSEDC